MEDAQFDSLTKQVALRKSRRQVLSAVLGVTGGAIVALSVRQPGDAARRGFSGPRLSGPVQTCLDAGESCGNRIDECCSGCCVSAGGGLAVCVAQTSCL